MTPSRTSIALRDGKETVFMKEVRELVPEILTAEQKLGLLLCANLAHGEADLEDALTMIREHRLGAVWVPTHHKDRDRILARIRETADYPILIMCDAECGYPGYEIPSTISLSSVQKSRRYARAFGRLTATLYAALGYNVICSPVLDRTTRNKPCGGTTRSLSPDKETVAALAAEICRGMHEGGTLSVAKHYPSSQRGKPFDSHMREGFSTDTREELLEDALYPYRALIAEDLIDGVMVGHSRLVNIDPDRPASLSRPVLDILRDCGFRGFYITDALIMMGIVLKYGNDRPTPMAVEAGCDLPLSWGIPCKRAYAALLEGYRDGMIKPERLEDAVRHVLFAQHRAAALPRAASIREEDVDCIRRLGRESVSGVIAEGYTPAIPRDGRHLFVVMVDCVKGGEQEFDVFAGVWYRPEVIEKKIRALFPASEVILHPNYPNPQQNLALFQKQGEYDDIVYITFCKTECFVGREALTSRTVDLMDALQSADRIAAHLHFGNPFVATDAPYVPRVILGWGSEACILAALDILAGEGELCGVQPYAPYLHFHKKGDDL